MGFTQKIKEYFFNQGIKKQTSTASRKSKFANISFANAKKVAIIFDATDLKQRGTIEQYAQKLSKQNKSVHLLGYVQGKSELDNYTFPCYNDKNIDWASRVNGNAFDDFKSQQFDVLISAWTQSNNHAEYIAATSNAIIKAGAVPQLIAPFDIMLDVSTSTTLQQFLSQLEALLAKITK